MDGHFAELNKSVIFIGIDALVPGYSGGVLLGQGCDAGAGGTNASRLGKEQGCYLWCEPDSFGTRARVIQNRAWMGGDGIRCLKLWGWGL